jgi:hypothetical protein
MHSRALLPLEQVAVAVMLERAGGRIVVTDADLAEFDRRCTILAYSTPVGLVMELHRSPYTVSGEVVGERAAIGAGPELSPG